MGRERGAWRSSATRATRSWLSALLIEGRSPRQLPARTATRRTGGDLLSQEVSPQVPSALKGLTALFGMGRGVSLSLCATGDLRDANARWSLKTAQDLKVRNIRQALDPLVPVGYVHCCTSTAGLSTWWSTRGLTPSGGWESSSQGRLPA